MTDPQAADDTLPHNIEAEQAILGAVLAPDKALDGLQFLVPADFFDPVHQRFFADMLGERAAGRRITPMLLKSKYGSAVIAEGLTVTDYLRRLVAGTIGVNDDIVVPLAQDVRRLARLRLVIAAGVDAANIQTDADVDAAIDSMQERLDGIRNGNARTSAVSLRDAMREAIQIAEAAAKAHGGVTGTPTGLATLDRRLGGFHAPDLVIIAGRPGMGKSALGMTAAKATAKTGKTALFFTLEMGAPQLAGRLIAEESGVSTDRQRRGMTGPHDFEDMDRAAQRIDGLPLVIDPGPRTLGELASAARKRHRQGDLGVIVVDYLQLLVTAGKSENRVQEVSQISRGLKSLAVELNVPVIALSQLSRQVEQRDDKRPQLSDLRESGSIEQDADLVLFLFREAYYLDQKKPKQNPGEDDYTFNSRRADWERNYEQIKDKAEVITAKNRHGPTGSDAVSFNAELTSFRDLHHG